MRSTRSIEILCLALAALVLIWSGALTSQMWPVLGLLVRRDLYSDKRLRLLLAIAVWVFVFFSVSTNKLPGYLLPMLPSIAILAGVALERSDLASRIVIALSGLSR